MKGIRCPRCGWQNEPTALMCGGCGQPLPTPGLYVAGGSVGRPAYLPPPGDPAGPTRPILPPNAAAPGRVGYVPLSDEPTIQDLPRVLPPLASPPGKAPIWPQAGAPLPAPAPPGRRRRGSCLGSCLLTFVLLLAALAAGVWGAWAFAIRPALHTSADNAIRSGLRTALANLPALTPEELKVGLTTIPINEDDVNGVLEKRLASAGGLVTAQVAFQSGRVVVQYSALRLPGTISTTLTAQGSRLVATNTQVSGALGQVETGDELQTTLNQVLAELQSKTPYGFSDVQSKDGTLTLRLNATGG
jgi:hypothetical protein